MQWKTRRKIMRTKRQTFPSHPYGNCSNYIEHKLKYKCNLLEQDFRTPKTCEQGCLKKVYCFEIKIGSTINKLCFDTPGPPWIKHNCSKRENEVDQEAGYKPCLIDKYVSNYLPVNGTKMPCLLFQIQIVTNGSSIKALLLIREQEKIRQFIREIRQPFFYRERDLHHWILNTYQARYDDAGENLLYYPKEYICIGPKI